MMEREELVKLGWLVVFVLVGFLVAFFKGRRESADHRASLHFPFLNQDKNTACSWKPLILKYVVQGAFIKATTEQKC